MRCASIIGSEICISAPLNKLTRARTTPAIATSTELVPKIRNCHRKPKAYADQSRAYPKGIPWALYPNRTGAEIRGRIDEILGVAMEANDELKAEEIEVVASSDEESQRDRVPPQFVYIHRGILECGPMRFAFKGQRNFGICCACVLDEKDFLKRALWSRADAHIGTRALQPRQAPSHLVSMGPIRDRDMTVGNRIESFMACAVRNGWSLRAMKQHWASLRSAFAELIQAFSVTGSK